MRVLFLTETIPFPLDTGGRIKTYHTIRALSREHQVDTHAFIREERQRRFQGDLEACCRSVTLHMKPRSPLGEAWALASGWGTDVPFLVHRHFDRGVMRQLHALAATNGYDAVYCDHLSMLEYGRRLKLPIIYDAHNVEFEIIRRHASTLGYAPMRIFAEAEWRMLRRYERRMFAACELIYSVSEVDAREIREMSGGTVPISVVPIAVDATAASLATPAAAGRELLFVGGMHWPPNADAVAYFVKDIFPLVRQRLPDVRLTVVGKSGAAQQALAATDGVTFTGYVDDIEPLFQRSRAMVVPLRAGSGMRVKILDALARGMPIVTTSVGCEGIDVVPGTHLLAADTPVTFAEQVVRVLTDDRLAVALSREGRELARNTYDAAVVGRRTLDALNQHWRLCPSPGLPS